MSSRSLRGKYWYCKKCREFVPDEMEVCECGNPRYGHAPTSNANILVSVLPKGLRGDKMYIRQQSGQAVVDGVQKHRAKELHESIGRNMPRNGPGSLEHYSR